MPRKTFKVYLHPNCGGLYEEVEADSAEVSNGDLLFIREEPGVESMIHGGLSIPLNDVVNLSLVQAYARGTWTKMIEIT